MHRHVRRLLLPGSFRAAGFAMAMGAAMGVAFLPSAAEAGPKIAVDVASGRVLEHEQAFQRWYPASLTKLMTAYVAFRAIKSGRISLDTPIRMTAEAAKEPPSKMYFKPGVSFTLDSALKYLLVKSANDVAVAISQAVGGSESAFVELMNAEARRIGMTSSRFINPNGLPGNGQYTTAHDMAVLAVALRREFPELAHYFALEGFSTGKKTFLNYNILIGRFDGADGMKTGFICASGFNQVSSATRGGKTVVSVVFGAGSQEERAESSAKLLHKALTSSGFGAVTLSSLAPYGAGRDQVADISGEICTPEARAARYEGRDVEGRMVLRSPYISTAERTPVIVDAPVGAKTALAAARVPIPTPRPVDGPGMAEARTSVPGLAAPSTASAFAAPQAPAMLVTPSIPLPVPRPAP